MNYLFKKNMKHIVLLFLILFNYIVVGQIKIDDVGDGWVNKVNDALILIKKVDSEKYDKLLEVCDHITFWNGTFSTTENDHTIMITQTDMVRGSVNNVAAVLVHESRHLYFRKNGIKLKEIDEETMAYVYELQFLEKIPGVEQFLIDNAKRRIVKPK
jgi:hypothetical protein